MTTLVIKIWLCLLIAFLLGLLIGWIWKSMCCKSKLSQLQAQHSKELTSVRHQENSQMQALLAEMDELKQRYQKNSTQGEVINAVAKPVASAISYNKSENVTPKAPNLFSEAPQDKDDLKQIVGIGPVFEGMLNDLGIYKFEQLAALDEENVHWIAEHIDLFPDRIYTDRWVEQAAALARANEDQ